MKHHTLYPLFGLLLTTGQISQVNAKNNDQALENKLMHHRFILTKVNGKPIKTKQTRPSLSFGEKMFVSASMCNDFNGFAYIKNTKITVKNINKTEVECVDENLSIWDLQLNKMLTKGSNISLTGNRLVISQGRYTLVYIIRDYVN